MVLHCLSCLRISVVVHTCTLDIQRLLRVTKGFIEGELFGGGGPGGGDIDPIAFCNMSLKKVAVITLPPAQTKNSLYKDIIFRCISMLYSLYKPRPLNNKPKTIAFRA